MGGERVRVPPYGNLLANLDKDPSGSDWETQWVTQWERPKVNVKREQPERVISTDIIFQDDFRTLFAEHSQPNQIVILNDMHNTLAKKPNVAAKIAAHVEGRKRELEELRNPTTDNGSTR